MDGNQDDMFFVNPSTGIVVTKKALDYELNQFYNLTVEATNMVSTIFFRKKAPIRKIIFRDWIIKRFYPKIRRSVDMF
jgi:hypothetical protein